ncbi:MAG TPA: hypothetical protein VEG63_08485 [Candidatus Acidoferrales bacterium]|nr:hypothetical protein [Candidatus Acidoferrales bacterium]
MTDVRALVEGLAVPDPGRRLAARWQLHRAGCALVEEIFAAWRKDPEFAVLITGEPVVGIAVPPDLFARIRQEMDMPALANVPAEQSTAEFEIHDRGPLMDVLTPVDSEGPIQKFLDRFGPGIQQVELPVSNIEAALKILTERFGLAPMYPETWEGANGTRVNFFLMDKPGGGKVLIELFEAKR